MLLDTNLLVLLLLGNTDPALIRENTRTSKYTEDDYTFLVKALGEDTVLVLTPHILTETSNLVGKLRGETREHFFLFLSRYVQIAQERSKEAKLLMQDETFERLGVTDVGILAMKRSKPLVLTDDLGLYLELERRAHPVINYAHVYEALHDS